MITLNNHKVFFILFFLLCAYFFGNKILFYKQSSFATGTVTHLFDEYYRTHPGDEKTKEPVIIFTRGNDTTFFHADDEYYYIIRAQVPVIYKTAEPQDAYIFDLMGFWLNRWAYYAPVLLIMAALVYSLIGTGDKIEINLLKFSARKIKKPVEKKKAKK